MMCPKEHYKQFGYAVLRGFFNEQEIDLIDSHVERIFQQWRLDKEEEIYNYKMVNMHSLTSCEYFQDSGEQRVEFFNLIATLKLTATLEHMFGSGIHFHNTQLFFNPSNPARLPYWHRDMQYSSVAQSVQRETLTNMLSLHVRIPLVKEQGIEVIPGTHTRWDTELERKVRLELAGHTNNEPLPNAELISLARGDVLIFNAQMIHRGSYTLNATRKALDLCVGKYHPLTSDFLNPHVLPSDEEISKIDNNQWYKLARDIAANKFKSNT